MNEEKKKQFSQEELKQLCAFFEILMEVDLREKITDSAKSFHAKESNIKDSV